MINNYKIKFAIYVKGQAQPEDPGVHHQTAGRLPTRRVLPERPERVPTGLLLLRGHFAGFPVSPSTLSNYNLLYYQINQDQDGGSDNDDQGSQNENEGNPNLGGEEPQQQLSQLQPKKESMQLENEQEQNDDLRKTKFDKIIAIFIYKLSKHVSF